MAVNAFKIDLKNEKMQGQYIRLPRAFNAQKLTPSARVLKGEVYTFTKKEEDEKRICKTNVKQLAEKFGFSAPTICKGLKTLQEESSIEKVERDKDGTGYIYTGEEKLGKGYDVIPIFLFHTSSIVDGAERELSVTAIRLLSHMMTDVENVKNGGVSSGSARQYARILNVSEKAIKNATYILLKAGLIFRPIEDRGVNSHKMSRYHVNRDLFLYKKRHQKKARAKTSRLSDDVQAANARAERERFYSQRREEMQRRREKYLAIANADAEYKATTVELNGMPFKIAKAEIHNLPELNELRSREKALQARRVAALHRLNITIDDIEGSYICPKCRDSGYLPDGRGCDCYQRE